MKFQIPFTISTVELLKKRSSFLKKRNDREDRNLKFQQFLDATDTSLTYNDYIAICIRSFAIFFILFYILFAILFVIIKLKMPFVMSFGGSLLVSFFIFLLQYSYPRVYANRKKKAIERNLIPA